ncbi:hypothetical protein [Streptomyces sp. NPDC056169]|uniref:hypothetical protein n=1 Tax=Streptomyces sp. NPDC056169 TaxID=3345734 RepID=UPI0035E1C10D
MGCWSGPQSCSGWCGGRGAYATWVPAADVRRLGAYKVFAAYDNNQAGEFAEFRDGAAARERRAAQMPPASSG